MDIRNLRIFLAVLEQGSITAAAQDLGISQPALSKQLSRLETEMGTPLLERLPRGVRANANGQVLQHYAKAIEANYRNVIRRMNMDNQPAHEELTIGAGYFWLQGLVPRVLAELTRERPACRVQIVAGVPEALTTRMLDGELDLVLGPIGLASAQNDQIASQGLIRTNTRVLVRAHHPWANDEFRNIAQMQELDWILPAGTLARKRFDQLFELHGLTPPRPVIEVNDVQGTLDIVMASDCATLANSCAPTGENWNSLTALNCPDLESDRETGVLYLRDNLTTPIMQFFIDSLTRTAQQHPYAVQ